MDLRAVYFQFMGVENYLLDGSQDVEIDLDGPLIAIFSPQLKVIQRNGVVNWFDTAYPVNHAHGRAH